MKLVVVLALGVAVIAAAAVQFAADGALGSAAQPATLPRALANLIGPGPARALGIAPARPAGDALAVGAEVDRLDAAGEYARARAMQRALITRLQSQGTNREVLADGLWRLGKLDAEVGYREPALRRAQWREALQDYRLALDLVPLSVTILLAAGNQALLNGDRPTAAEYFRRALANDPGSAAAREGLQHAQTGQGIPPPFVAPAEWKAH